MKSGVFASKNNLTMQSQIPSTSAAINPIVIQLPSQLYSNQEHSTSYPSNA